MKPVIPFSTVFVCVYVVGTNKHVCNLSFTLSALRKQSLRLVAIGSVNIAGMFLERVNFVCVYLKGIDDIRDHYPCLPL